MITAFYYFDNNPSSAYLIDQNDNEFLINNVKNIEQNVLATYSNEKNTFEEVFINQYESNYNKEKLKTIGNIPHSVIETDKFKYTFIFTKYNERILHNQLGNPAILDLLNNSHKHYIDGREVNINEAKKLMNKTKINSF
jgi:hypothetical protein